MLGWSSGGNTVLALATKRPDLYRSLVLAEPPWHGLRHATLDMLAMLSRVKLSELRGRRRDVPPIFFRWISGLRSGGNGSTISL